MSDINFYEFLKNSTNQSLAPLQANPAYDDLVSGIANLFQTVYQRAIDVKIGPQLDINANTDFQKYLNENDGTVVKDIILEKIAEYLDTSHFKDTIAILIRLYEERNLGTEIPNLDIFVANHIIPSFKFFTINAGTLHKSKGIKTLLESLFEFYSPTDPSIRMFDGINEKDELDEKGTRLNRYTSYRIGINELLLKQNYSDLSNIKLNIISYLELNTKKLVVAEKTNGYKYVFISDKQREDWWIVDSNISKLIKMDEDYFAIYKNNSISVYSDSSNIYDDNFIFVSPSVIESVEDVVFIPKVINIEDKFNQYHNGVLYYVEYVEYTDTTDTIPSVPYVYNLKRLRNLNDNIIIEDIKPKLGISFDPYYKYEDIDTYPKISQYISFDYLWLNFYDKSATAYDFDIRDVDIVYSYIMEYKYEDNTGGSVEVKTSNFLTVARDGYNYDYENSVFQRRPLSTIEINLKDKYILQERVLSKFLETEMKKIISNNIKDILSVMDLFFIKENTSYSQEYFTNKGTWDANNSSNSKPSDSPSHGDYWVVSNDGNIILSGIKNWRIGDVVVWNDSLGIWEKNNKISEIESGENSKYVIEHKLIFISEV